MRLPVPGRALAAALALLLVAAAPAPKPGGVEVRTADYTFSYRWPAAVEAIPALRARLDAEQAGLRRDLARNAAEWREAVASDPDLHRDRIWAPYDMRTEWKVVANLPGWLSLSKAYSLYEGGAHPNHNFGSLVWDRGAGQARRPLDLFVSAKALDAAIRKPFCDALDRQRAERRGAPVNRASGDDFDACIAPSEQTVILGSSNRKTFNRIGILVPHYAAGPYAEGAYDVTVPVTPEVLKAVKPEFRAAFSP